jgi:hypothetical protein
LFSCSILAADLRVTLECSADFYALEDSVFFTWTNNTDSTLTAAYHPPYEIYDDVTSGLIYSGELPWEFSLLPHESVELSWNQLGWRQEQVPPGPYLVWISFWFNEGPPPPWGHVEDRFVILSPASVPDVPPAVSATSWGRLKLRYR